MGGLITILKSDLDNLISSNSLVKGGWYEVPGADVSLYGGTTILLQATSENTISQEGIGIFYDPNYSTYNIWDNYIRLEIQGTDEFLFNMDELVTTENGATAYIKSFSLLQYISGNWTVNSIITGNDSGFTSSFVVSSNPTYSVGDKVCWGGRVWENLSGNIGNYVDKYNLDSEWGLVDYNEVDYIKVSNRINYDYTNDRIVGRIDSRNNSVLSRVNFINNIGDNPVKAFQWGKDDVYSNEILDSYCNIINNQGYFFLNKLQGESYFGDVSSYQYNGFNTEVSNNTLLNSLIRYNIFGTGTFMLRNTFRECLMENNRFNNTSLYDNNLLQQSGFKWNNIYNSSIFGNEFTINFSYNKIIRTTSGNVIISNNTISEFNHNTISGECVIQYNKQNAGLISNNKFYLGDDAMFISYNIIDSSYIQRNNFTSGSIENTKLLNSYISDNDNWIKSSISGCDLISSHINSCVSLYRTEITNNTLLNDSDISNISATNSRISFNVIANRGGVTSTILTDSDVSYNVIHHSSIYNNILNYSVISYNNLSSSGINNNNLTASNIQNNTLNDSILDFGPSGLLSEVTISKIEAKSTVTSHDISGATIIYGDYSKSIFTNSVGVPRLSFYNEFDILTITDIDSNI